MIAPDKWLLLNLTTDDAQVFRLIEDACRDAGDYGFYMRTREELKIGITPQDIMKRYRVTG